MQFLGQHTLSSNNYIDALVLKLENKSYNV